MTGPIPFSAHPRRVVRDPDGRPALVGIRRNLPRHHRTMAGYVNDWVHPLLRLLRRDRTWVVELHPDVARQEVLASELSDSGWLWVEADRPAAEVRAEEVCDRWRRGEIGPRPPAR